MALTRRARSWCLGGAALGALVLLASCGSPGHPRSGPTRPAYDSMVLGLHPYAYYHLAGTHRTEPDLVGDHAGTWTRAPGGARHVRLPDGSRVLDFAVGDYLTIPSAPGFSIPTTGRFTLLAWIRPDTLQFDATEGAGYVHWLGKGEDGAQEWALRMYSLVNAQDRPNRISAYVFNAGGGEGSGAYVQRPVVAHEWIMIGFEVSTAASPTYPKGWVAIFSDGRERARVGLDQFDVTPRAGPAPVRIGTRDLESFFQGGIGDVAFFDRIVPPDDVLRLYADMTGRR